MFNRSPNEISDYFDKYSVVLSSLDWCVCKLSFEAKNTNNKQATCYQTLSHHAVSSEPSATTPRSAGRGSLSGCRKVWLRNHCLSERNSQHHQVLYARWKMFLNSIFWCVHKNSPALLLCDRCAHICVSSSHFRARSYSVSINHKINRRQKFKRAEHRAVSHEFEVTDKHAAENRLVTWHARSHNCLHN